MKRLLVTLDGSAESEAVIPVAVELARAAELEVHLLRVAEIPASSLVSRHAEVDPYRARYREPLLASALPDPRPRPIESRDQAVGRADHEAREYLEDRGRQFDGLTVHTHVRFDGDAATASASRAALIANSAASGQRIYAVHFPFPGVGKFEPRGDGFSWVAE